MQDSPPPAPQASTRGAAPPADDVLRRAATGDGSAWRELVDAYHRRVYGLVLKQTGDAELSEEITQATFVKVLEKLGRHRGYEERGRFEAWMFRIAMNRLRDEMRRRRRQARTMDMTPGAAGGRETPGGWAAAQQSVISGGPVPAEDPLDVVDRAEQLDRLRELVTTMSDADREILHLRHTAGLSFPQIAEALNQPLGTVLARGHRALKKLRSMLEEAEPTRSASKGHAR